MSISRKCVEKTRFTFISDLLIGYFNYKLAYFYLISCHFFLNWDLSEANFMNNQHAQFVFNSFRYPFCLLRNDKSIRQIARRNRSKYNAAQVLACWITKPANTYLENKTPVAFSKIQLLGEHTSKLCYRFFLSLLVVLIDTSTKTPLAVAHVISWSISLRMFANFKFKTFVILKVERNKLLNLQFVYN